MLYSYANSYLLAIRPGPIIDSVLYPVAFVFRPHNNKCRCHYVTDASYTLYGLTGRDLDSTSQDVAILVSPDTCHAWDYLIGGSSLSLYGDAQRENQIAGIIDELCQDTVLTSGHLSREIELRGTVVLAKSSLRAIQHRIEFQLQVT